MTNYKKALIFIIVVVVSLVSGMLFAYEIVPRGIPTIVSGMVFGFFLGLIGRAYFYGDNS